MALGAQRADIVRMVLAQSLVPVACGSIAGALLSLALAPLLSSLLFAVRPLDPATWAAAISLLLAGTLLASWGPARRATGVEPTVARRRD